MDNNSVSPVDIAKLIQEDAALQKQPQQKPEWDKQKEYVVEALEVGREMYTVYCTIGANFHKGEPMVRYYSDGSGYPGSPDEIEWDVLSIDKVFSYDESGNESEAQLTPELKEALVDAVRNTIDDDYLMDDLFSQNDEPDYEPDYSDPKYDHDFDKDL